MPRPKKAGPKHNINPSLATLAVAIGDLREDPDNANLHNERSVEDIAASFKEFGQQKPLVYKKGGTVVAGNGGLRAAKRLGWTHVAAVLFEGTSERARAYAIADNRTAEHSERDEDVLGRQLRDLAEAWADFRPEMVGYTQAEASKLPGGYGSPLIDEPVAEEPDDENEAGEGAGEAVDPDPDAPDEFKEVDETLPFEYQCPRCQHKWSGRAK
jgi:ParB-like chromosome segregation protein Spo0J